MKNDDNRVFLGFENESYPAGTHMCLIYNDERERRKIIGKYLEGGYKGGERVAYFADEISPPEVFEWLTEMGIEISDEERETRFSSTGAADTYCPNGTFDPQQMLNTLRSFYESSISDGYSNCRVSGEMGWALKGIPGSDRLMEYEALVNDVLETHPVTAVCQYDAKKFDGATILQCLEVHPYIIVRGQIVHNPYYLRPEQFLSRSH